eukprot:jgi/Orpsp1_1/1185696/evm.model.c7180000094868.1
MKTLNVLSLIAFTLAAKVSANLWEQPVVINDECFSVKLGYPCCKQAKEVFYVDEDGEWSVENNNWCGIKKIENNAANPANLWEQPVVKNEEQNPSTSVGSDYMSKLNVVTSCPSDAISKQAGVEYPTPQKVRYHSKTTNSERPMNIILPPGYNESKKYPVLYLLHGIMGNEDSMLDESMGSITIPTNLIKAGKAKEMIIVLPNEYAPEGGKEVPADFNQEYFDGYDNFINDLVDSIMPYMEDNYSIATGRENTAICGFSMGGRNSLYIGFKRSDLFGYVGAFSPAPGVTPGTDFSGYHKGLFTEDAFRPQISPYVTLISCGTNDSVVGQFPKSYHEILTRNNQEHIWFEIQGADHDGVAVSAGYYNFISAAFGALN